MINQAEICNEMKINFYKIIIISLNGLFFGKKFQKIQKCVYLRKTIPS
jgi:hypothetical protein